MFGLGLDIGYSGLKMTMGDLEGGFQNVKTLVLPVGAAPVSNCIESDNDTSDNRIPVTINGEPWYACIDPHYIMRDQRSLNYDYADTLQYEAIFKAALMLTERDEIDLLVTGLPVSQAKDEAMVEKLVQMMTGEHAVSARKTVTVKRVIVRPQPGAAFVRMVYQCADDKQMVRRIKEGQTVVVDPGFFSVDWVTIKGGGLLRETSGTSIRAMFRLIEQAAEAIRRDYGAGANIRTAIERALRAGEREVLANGEFIDLTPYLEAAADEVAPVALAAMKADMALQDNVADVLVLAGGGGHLYEKAAREIFQDCRYVVSFENAVTAISEGYWLIAQGIASQIQSNAA